MLEMAEILNLNFPHSQKNKTNTLALCLINLLPNKCHHQEFADIAFTGKGRPDKPGPQVKNHVSA